MSLLGAAALVSGGISAVKGIIGAIQGFGANKKIKDQWANRPTYKKPEAIDSMIDIYRKAASRSQLPGQDLIEGKLGRTTSKSLRYAEKYAPSSAALLESARSANEAEINAIRDLGIEFAQYRDAAEQRLAAGKAVEAQYEDQEFYYNKALPWETRMNEFQSRKQAGFQNMWSGVSGAASTFMDFAGTKYYSDTLKSLYSPGGAVNQEKL